MEEIEKKEVEQTTDEAAIAAKKKQDEEAEAKAKAEKSTEINYKAELEKEKTLRLQKEDQLKKAEFKLTQNDIEARKNKKVEIKDGEDELKDKNLEDIETPNIRDEISKAKEELKREMFDDLIQDELARFADNPDKLELVKYHLDNTVKRSGYSKADIARDIQIAEAIADKPRLEREKKDLIDAVKAAKGTNKDGTSTGQKVDDDTIIELSPLEKRILERQGLTAKDVKTS